MTPHRARSSRAPESPPDTPARHTRLAERRARTVTPSPPPPPASARHPLEKRPQIRDSSVRRPRRTLGEGEVTAEGEVLTEMLRIRRKSSRLKGMPRSMYTEEDKGEEDDEGDEDDEDESRAGKVVEDEFVIQREEEGEEGESQSENGATSMGGENANGRRSRRNVRNSEPSRRISTRLHPVEEPSTEMASSRMPRVMRRVLHNDASPERDRSAEPGTPLRRVARRGRGRPPSASRATRATSSAAAAVAPVPWGRSDYDPTLPFGPISSPVARVLMEHRATRSSRGSSPSASESMSRMTEAARTLDNIHLWRKVDLVMECRRRSLRVSGNKSELRERILADVQNEQDRLTWLREQKLEGKEETMQIGEDKENAQGADKVEEAGVGEADGPREDSSKGITRESLIRRDNDIVDAEARAADESVQHSENDENRVDNGKGKADGDGDEDVSIQMEASGRQHEPPEAGGNEAAPTDATMVDVAETDAAPADTAPADAASVDAAPTDAAPTDAAPTDAAPTDAAPTDAAPTDAVSRKAAPTTVASVQADPIEVARVEVAQENEGSQDGTTENCAGGMTASDKLDASSVREGEGIAAEAGRQSPEIHVSLHNIETETKEAVDSDAGCDAEKVQSDTVGEHQDTDNTDDIVMRNSAVESIVEVAQPSDDRTQGVNERVALSVKKVVTRVVQNSDEVHMNVVRYDEKVSIAVADVNTSHPEPELCAKPARDDDELLFGYGSHSTPVPETYFANNGSEAPQGKESVAKNIDGNSDAGQTAAESNNLINEDRHLDQPVAEDAVNLPVEKSHILLVGHALDQGADSGIGGGTAAGEQLQSPCAANRKEVENNQSNGEYEAQQHDAASDIGSLNTKGNSKPVDDMHKTSQSWKGAQMFRDPEEVQKGIEIVTESGTHEIDTDQNMVIERHATNPIRGERDSTDGNRNADSGRDVNVPDVNTGLGTFAVAQVDSYRNEDSKNQLQLHDPIVSDVIQKKIADTVDEDTVLKDGICGTDDHEGNFNAQDEMIGAYVVADGEIDHKEEEDKVVQNEENTKTATEETDVRLAPDRGDLRLSAVPQEKSAEPKNEDNSPPALSGFSKLPSGGRGEPSSFSESPLPSPRPAEGQPDLNVSYWSGKPVLSPGTVLTAPANVSDFQCPVSEAQTSGIEKIRGAPSVTRPSASASGSEEQNKIAATPHNSAPLTAHDEPRTKGQSNGDAGNKSDQPLNLQDAGGPLQQIETEIEKVNRDSFVGCGSASLSSPRHSRRSGPPSANDHSPEKDQYCEAHEVSGSVVGRNNVNETVASVFSGSDGAEDYFSRESRSSQEPVAIPNGTAAPAPQVHPWGGDQSNDSRQKSSSSDDLGSADDQLDYLQPGFSELPPQSNEVMSISSDDEDEQVEPIAEVLREHIESSENPSSIDDRDTPPQQDDGRSSVPGKELQESHLLHQLRNNETSNVQKESARLASAAAEIEETPIRQSANVGQSATDNVAVLPQGASEASGEKCTPLPSGDGQVSSSRKVVSDEHGLDDTDRDARTSLPFVQTSAANGMTGSSTQPLGAVHLIMPPTKVIRKPEEPSAILQGTRAALSILRRDDPTYAPVEDARVIARSSSKTGLLLPDNWKKTGSQTSGLVADLYVPPPSPAVPQAAGVSTMLPPKRPLALQMKELIENRQGQVQRQGDNVEIERHGSLQSEEVPSHGKQRDEQAMGHLEVESGQGALFTGDDGVASPLHPSKKRKTHRSLVPFRPMPTPASTLRVLKPLLSYEKALHLSETNRSLDWSGQSSPSTPSSILEKLSQIEQNHSAPRFTAFRDTIGERLAAQNRYQPVPPATLEPAFHVGSIPSGRKVFSQPAAHKRARVRMMQARRGQDAAKLAAASLQRAREMAQKVASWQHTRSPFENNDVGSSFAAQHEPHTDPAHTTQEEGCPTPSSRKRKLY